MFKQSNCLLSCTKEVKSNNTRKLLKKLKFWPLWAQIGPHRPKFGAKHFFEWQDHHHVLNNIIIYYILQKKKNLMTQTQENYQKLEPFWAYLTQL